MEYIVNACEDFAIDGILSAREWKKAPVWQFSRIGIHPEELGPELNESGQVRMLHSEEYVYVGVTMEDSDVVQQGTADQTHLYASGDTIELFFKPADDTYYWELYGTPNELRTQFFYPSRSYVFLPKSADGHPEFEVKAKIDGAFNDWRTTDRGWSIEFRIPKRILEQHGAGFRSGRPWQFLIARQNYSRPLPFKELSTVPAIKEPDFHLIRQYGILDIR